MVNLQLGKVGMKPSVLSLVLQVIPLIVASVDAFGNQCSNVRAVEVAWNRLTLRLENLIPESVYNLTYAPADQNIIEEYSWNFLSIPVASGNKTLVDVVVTDLQPSTNYVFRLVLTDSKINCTDSERQKSLIVKTEDITAGVTALSVANVGEHSLTLSVGIGAELIAQKAKLICVFYSSEGDPVLVEQFSVQGTTGAYTIYHLKQFVLYNVYAAAALVSCTQPLAGSASASMTAHTLDHDECEYGALQSCGPHSICTNTPGSYFCSCIDGYVLIGKECYDKNSTKSTSEDECDGEESRGVFWPPTKLGLLVTRPCPEGSTGEATRLCLALRKTHKAKWQRPSLRHCVSGWVKNLRTRVKNMRSITGAPVASPRILSAAEELRESLLKSEMIYGGDVNGIVEVLDSLVIFNSAALGKNVSHTTSFAESGLRVTNELVDRKSLVAWHDLTEQQRLVDADKLLTATERLAEESIALAGNSSSKEFVIEEKNVVMKVRQVASREDVDKVIVTNSSEVLLPPLMTHDGSRISLAVIEYRGMSEILGNPGNASLKARGFNTTLSSHVLSVTVFPKNLSAFHEPFVMVHKLSQQEGSGYTPNCVYWESPTDSSGGIWSDDGCRVRSANVSHVTCECSHLTNFAILMSVTDASRKMEEKHRLALNLITLIGITISLLALFLALLTFVFVRSIRSIRNTIHQNLAVALFIAELLFLAGIERTDYRIGCVIIGAALHYFFLVAFFVMGLEGIVLYLMLVKVYRSTGSTGYGNPKMVIACWVIPIAFVAVNIAVDRTAYGNDSYCWLSVQNGFIWSFVGPVLFVNLVNCVIFLLTIRVMMTKAKKRDSTTSEIWFWTKGSCLLLSILGITWVVGVFFVDRNTLPLAYVFTLLNCLQGLSVFVFHCLCDPRVRKAYFMLFCCVQPDGSSLIRRSTFSTPTRTSSSASSLLKKKRGTPKERKEPQDPSKELISSSGSASKAADNSLAALVGPNSM